MKTVYKYYELISREGDWFICNDVDQLFIGNFISYLQALDESSYLGYNLVDIIVTTYQCKYILKREVEKI